MKRRKPEEGFDCIEFQRVATLTALLPVGVFPADAGD
jgi:hypothetical protein